MKKHELTVQIMLGGPSKRMGTDKALVTLGGKTLLDRAVETWNDYGAGVQLSVGAPERKALAPAGTMAVADIYPDRGPLTGLHAGLRACTTRWMLLVGVNFPFLTPAQADTLVDAIGDADACVYTMDGVPQPLFGVYRKRCMSFAETMMLNGEDYDTLALLGNQSVANYRHLLAGTDLLAIDEAQNVPHIGRILKLIVDEVPGVILRFVNRLSDLLFTMARGEMDKQGTEEERWQEFLYKKRK